MNSPEHEFDFMFLSSSQSITTKGVLKHFAQSEENQLGSQSKQGEAEARKTFPRADPDSRGQRSSALPVRVRETEAGIEVARVRINKQFKYSNTEGRDVNHVQPCWAEEPAGSLT